MGDSGPMVLRVPRNTMVADAVQGNQWGIRRCRSQVLCALVSSLQLIPTPRPENGPDLPLWRQGLDEYKHSFSSRHTWDHIRPRKNKVLWHKTVWFPQNVPRFSFIDWLAKKGRLTTGTKMCAWGAVQPCCLCGERDESRTDTFTVWSELTSCILRHMKIPKIFEQEQPQSGPVEASSWRFTRLVAQSIPLNQNSTRAIYIPNGLTFNHRDNSTRPTTLQLTSVVAVAATLTVEPKKNLQHYIGVLKPRRTRPQTFPVVKTRATTTSDGKDTTPPSTKSKNEKETWETLFPRREKTKEGGGSASIQSPMLNATNYTVWVIRMKIALKVHKAWDAIETKTNRTHAEKNDITTALFFQSIHEALVLQIGELDTTKKVWDSIKARHVGAERVKDARLQTLMAEFDRLKMKDSEKIDNFAGKLSEISSKSVVLGVNIEESRLVKKFLKSIPRKKYIHIVASLEQVLDPNTTTFEDIVGRLKVYEERVCEEEESHEDQSKLMYANTNSQAGYSNREYNNEYRGRGCGTRGYYRGRCRGTSVKIIDRFKDEMASKFEMSDLGKLTYYLGIENPKESHGTAMKQCLRYVKGTSTLGLTYRRSVSNIPKLVGFSDSSHNVDPNDGRSTTGHIFYLGESSSPISWCSQKQDTVALSSCEAEFMAETEEARQAIWLQDLFYEVTGVPCERALIRIDNKSAIALTKNPVFHGRMEYVPGEEQKADILTNALGRVKFKEMRELIGVQNVVKEDFKL
ncbi:Reverse transcriptase zinc-binding domain [Arabidopsis thaliana x Arabidopsis arenosa]|uniref:Reverse transcriptase zinc-binding domain n=1 Tax=Arabidopsis thaliana x Arabidopsis arenosa TaxID=1240361 RepID=A0A8T2AX29_9BRAS|nr:Reverse transcriptase zinc-binding domain [Arabidopsis thaliana x Arabidopsis arenosa]